MSITVVMSGGGLKGAAAVGCLGTGHKLVLVHVAYGQVAAKAETDAVSRLAAAMPDASAVTVEMPHLIAIEEKLAEGLSGEEAESGPARRLPASTALMGLAPALVSVGIQCATRVAATRLVIGLSEYVDAEHLGLPARAGQTDRLKEFVYATNVMLDALMPKRGTLKLEAPLIDRTYAEIVRLAARARVPLEHTWSCVQPPSTGPRPSAVCGRCPACKARAIAFTDARLADPLVPSRPVAAAHVP